VFGRSKAAPAPPADQERADSGPGKNRPTPKRREVEAARKQPLVPAARTSTRLKGAEGKAARQAARQERMRSRELMMAGDERHLTSRDRGPARRFARDTVDSRWNVGELLLPVMLVVLMLSFVGNAARSQNQIVYTAVLAFTYGVVVLAVLDAFLMTRRLKRTLLEKFGPATQVRGIGRYAAMRAFQIRRTRIPRPIAKRGDRPT
jgi:hypothetical protein